MAKVSSNDIAELRRLAKEATPGPWAVEDRRRAALKNVRIVAGNHSIAEVCDVHQRDYQGSFTGDHVAADAVDAVGLANARMIAALSPATVLALCDAADRLREVADRLREVAEIAEELSEYCCNIPDRMAAGLSKLRDRWLAVRGSVLRDGNADAAD